MAACHLDTFCCVERTPLIAVTTALLVWRGIDHVVVIKIVVYW